MKRTVIAIDDQFNASVGLERSLLGPLGNRIILTVGLPLLAATDRETILNVLAHEHAHVINKDTNGGLRLAELERVFEFVFTYAPPHRTVSGRLLYHALGWLARPLEDGRVRLSREAEIAADRQAAASGPAIKAAQAVAMIAAAEAFIDERVHDSLKRELLGAMEPPRPPLARIIEEIGQLSDREVLNAYARKAWERPHDDLSDHPSWAQRLLALGYSEPPEIEPIATPALSTFLTQDFARKSIVDFDKAWTNEVANALER